MPTSKRKAVRSVQARRTQRAPRPAPPPAPPADYPYNEIRQIQNAYPGKITALNVQAIVGTEYELHHILGHLARESAKKQEKRGGCADWVASMHDILEALYLAIGFVTAEKLLSAFGKHMEQAEPARTLLFDLRTASLKYLKEMSNTKPSNVMLTEKHLERDEFRESILQHVRCIPPSPTSWGPEAYVPIAHLIHTGRYLFPEIEGQSVSVLAAKMHERLGPTFFNKVEDEHHRGRRLLMVAGVDRQTAWNFMVGAERKRRSRAKKSKG